MSSKQQVPNCGIMGIGTYVPDKYVSAQELAAETNIPLDVIVNKFGISQKVVASHDCMSSSMAIIAAKKAISNAAIDPSDIDIVVWAGSQHKDYLMWLAGINIAEAVGAKNAWSFDMSAMCSSVVAAIEISRSLLFANLDYKTVLIASGSRDHDFVDLSNQDTSFMFNMGAGGSALVIRKGFDKNRIFSSAFKIDSSFARSCVVQNRWRKDFSIKINEQQQPSFTINKGENFKERLADVTVKNFYYVIRKALKKSGLAESDIDYLAMLHIHKTAHEACLKEFNLDDRHSIYLNEYGHLSQNDQVLSIELGINNAKIKNGSNVVLVSAGIGFIWAATVIQWG